MAISRYLSACALGAALTFSTILKADTTAETSSVPEFKFGSTETVDVKPVYLEDAPAPAKEVPNVHGFIEVPFKSAYVTPRGLVVENQGLVIQPVGGIVFPIGDLGPVKGFTFVTGVWNSINTNQHDPNVGPWNEMDYFASFSGTVAKRWSGTLTYGAWNFPTNPPKPKTEHNIDFKLAFDDTDFLGAFALHPYADFFWAVSGSSTVALGRAGSTGYVELGVVPSFKLTPTPDYPLTFTFPTYLSVGPRSYWGKGGTALGTSAAPDGNVGVFSTAINVSVPLAFIPARYGYWHADAGLQYFYLVNDALLRAGRALSGNDNHNVFNASVGIGVNF